MELRRIILGAKKWSTRDALKRDWNENESDLLASVLAKEVRLFGGNTFANVFREDGPPYDEIVRDVADKFKANCSKKDPIESVECAIIAKVLRKAWPKMSEDERQALIAGAKLSGKAWMSGTSVLALMAVWQAGGFASYQILVIVTNWVVRQATGVGLATSGLSLATNAALTRIAGFLHPLLMSLSALVTAIQIAGPSYKVTTPAVVYIAYLRTTQAMIRCSKCETWLGPKVPKFCPECGAKIPKAKNGDLRLS